MKPRSKTLAAFTLIELSIVLVIIGLIVGGVLVGRDLIASSQLRAQVSQFEKFNSAVNTFRSKYDCLPGDCKTITSYFPQMTYPWGVSAAGNGDGIITESINGGGVNTTGFLYEAEPESVVFWMNLYVAGLTACCNPSNTTYAANYTIGGSFPSDMINGYGISANTMQGKNGYFWGINNNSSVSPTNKYDYSILSDSNKGVLRPSQAKAFDIKLDDGMPTTGNIYVVRNIGDNYIHPAAFNDNCMANTTPLTYNIVYNSLACALWVNMQ